MKIDLQTVVFLSSVNYFICTVFMFFLWRQTKKKFNGISFLVATFSMQTVSLFLIGIRGTVPICVSVIPSNFLVLSGIITALMGLERFFDMKSSQKLNFIMVVVFTLIHAYFVLIHPSLLIRSLNISIGMFFFCFQCFWLLIKKLPPESKKISFWTANVFFGFCLVSLARIINLLINGLSSEDYFHSGTFEMIAMFALTTLFLLLTYTLIMMVNQRLIIEIEGNEGNVRKSEEKYRIITENMTDVVWTCDLNANLTFISSSIERLTGETVEENMKKSFESRFTPESLSRIMPMFAQEFEKEKDPSVPKNRSRIIEAQQYRKDGSSVWVEMNVSFMRNESGMPIGFLGITREITDRKKTEEELLDRERRLQQIFDILPIGLWFADETGKLIMGNPAGVRIWGAEPKVGLDEYGVFKARRLPENVEIKGEEWALAKSVKEGVVVENELLEIDAFDGLKKVILNCTAPIMDDENKVKGAIVINQEVTEKYKYEEELKKSEEKYRLIAENMGNVITMLDMELNYIYGTPNVEQVFGFELDEYIKLRVDQTMTPESFRIVMKTFEEEMAAEMSGTADPKRTKVLELEEYRKDGSTIWMENVLSFVRDEAGRPIGVLSVSRDVTERRMALEEKARLTQQLFHAQKMESVGTLAGGIAHDFNNLLQVIGGYTSMLLTDQKRDVSEVDKLKTIEKAVDRASELVSNLLAFSRKNVSMKKEIDLNSEITASIKILERTIPKMVTIRTELDEAIQKISADPIQIEQIILNLGKNASDAMPDGGKILIKTENVENEKGKYVMMSFSDTGQGMDEKTKEHVFDPFFTTKEVGKGTGLGLASVYGIVESHGGHIHCESELGKGTVFYIYFPAVDTVGQSGKVITEKTAKLEGSETVLIVDDEKNIRDIYSTALKEFGYKIITACSGEEALLIFNENHKSIDLVILDLGMPGMGGFKCMLEMKKCAPNSKIIVASGYSEVFQTEDMIKSGASGFIQKPFKLKMVLEKIREILD